MRVLPVSSRKRSFRLAISSVSDIARMRAAASSMASGKPSRRWQMSPTAREFLSVTPKSGRTRRARSANNATASSANDIEGTRQIVSPATPIGSRLVASNVNLRQASRSSMTRAALASSRCSQLSRMTSTG